MSINNIVSQLLLDNSMSVGGNVAGKLGAVCSGGVQYGSGGISLTPSYMQKNTVNISAASILTLSETPVQLVPAPEGSQLIYVDKVLVQVNSSTTPYADGSPLIIQYNNSAGGSGNPCAAEFILASALITLSSPDSNGVVDANGGIYSPDGTSKSFTLNGDCFGFGVYLSVIAANYTAGNATLTVTTWYRVV